MMVIAVFAAGLGLVLAHGTTVYGVTDYDNASLENYQKLSDLNTQALEVNTATSEIQQQEDALDVIGFYFLGGFNAVKIGLQSFNTFNPIASEATDSLNLGAFGPILKSALIGLVLVGLIFGFVFKIIFKVDT